MAFAISIGASFQNKSVCADVFAVQVYPTVARSLGMGFCTSFSRIGGMIAPFIAQVKRQRLPKRLKTHLFSVHLDSA